MGRLSRCSIALDGVRTGSRYNDRAMTEMLCPSCGASWRCEHAPDPQGSGLRYVPPDGPTARHIGIEVARSVGEQIGAALLGDGDEVSRARIERVLLLQRLATNLGVLSGS